MQSMNGAQFLNIIPLFLLSVCFAALSAPSQLIVMVPLPSTYASSQSHKLEFNIENLKLIWLLVL